MTIILLIIIIFGLLAIYKKLEEILKAVNKDCETCQDLEDGYEHGE